MSAPRSRCQRTTASLSVRFQVAIASVGSAGSSMSRRPSATRTSFGVHHAVHAVAHRAQVLDLGVDERTRVERPRRHAARTASGMTSCGMRLAPRGTSRRTPRCASFQFTGSRHAYHCSVRSDSTFHASRMVAAGSMHCRNGGASSSRLIHAHPPHASHRTGTRLMSSGSQVVLGERSSLRDGGVLAVGAVAPAVERAREPALARPATLDDLDAAVAARVLERPHAHVVGAQHDDRLVEELVLDEVVRLRDLLEPARHLPDAGPQLLDFQLRRSPGRSSAPWEPGPGRSIAYGTGSADHF